MEKDKFDADSIIYMDDYFVVLCKKVGEDAQDLIAHFSDVYKKPVFAVHRLDRPVSGCFVFAFDSDSAKMLSKQFSSGGIKKEYRAICERADTFKGEHISQLGNTIRLEHELFFDKRIQKARVVGRDKKTKSGKNAILEFICCAHGERYEFMRVFPLTGRTHQIRVQLASIGLPIKGDIKYGSRRTEKMGGIRLHAHLISFIHPKTKKEATFFCDPPQEDRLWLDCTDSCNKSKERITPNREKKE